MQRPTTSLDSEEPSASRSSSDHRMNDLDHILLAAQLLNNDHRYSLHGRDHDHRMHATNQLQHIHQSMWPSTDRHPAVTSSLNLTASGVTNTTMYSPAIAWPAAISPMNLSHLGDQQQLQFESDRRVPTPPSTSPSESQRRQFIIVVNNGSSSSMTSRTITTVPAPPTRPLLQSTTKSSSSNSYPTNQVPTCISSRESSNASTYPNIQFPTRLASTASSNASAYPTIQVPTHLSSTASSHASTYPTNQVPTCISSRESSNASTYSNIQFPTHLSSTAPSNASTYPNIQVPTRISSTASSNASAYSNIQFPTHLSSTASSQASTYPTIPTSMSSTASSSASASSSSASTNTMMRSPVSPVTPPMEPQISSAKIQNRVVSSSRRTVREVDCACMICGHRLAVLVLYGTALALSAPMRKDVLCTPCHDILNRPPPTATESTTTLKRSAARKEGNDHAPTLACKLCQVSPLGHGSIRSLNDRNEPCEPPFSVEIICLDCITRFKFCSNCGGGSSVIARAGKWRPAQMFVDERRTCVLPHHRVGGSSNCTFASYLIFTTDTRDHGAIVPIGNGETPPPYSDLPHADALANIERDVLVCWKDVYLVMVAEASFMSECPTQSTWHDICSYLARSSLEISDFIRGRFRLGVALNAGDLNVRRYLCIGFLPPKRPTNARLGGRKRRRTADEVEEADATTITLDDTAACRVGGFSMVQWNITTRAVHTRHHCCHGLFSLSRSSMMPHLVLTVISRVKADLVAAADSRVVKPPLHIWARFRISRGRSMRGGLASMRRLGLVTMDEYVRGWDPADVVTVFDDLQTDDAHNEGYENWVGSWETISAFNVNAVS